MLKIEQNLKLFQYRDVNVLLSWIFSEGRNLEINMNTTSVWGISSLMLWAAKLWYKINLNLEGPLNVLYLPVSIFNRLKGLLEKGCPDSH